MKYAIIRIKNNQYKVAEKEELLIDKFLGKKIEPEVLLMSVNGKVKIGKPTVKGAKVKIKIVESLVKGKKLTISKFKAKSRYRKKIGFRPQYTKLLIEKIN